MNWSAFFDSAVSFLSKDWKTLTVIGIFISGLILVIKNLYSIFNLRLQNKKLKEEHNSIAIEERQDTIEYRTILGNKLKISYSDVSRKELKTFSLDREQLFNLISLEFKSHPIFAKLDYESLPIPLKDGFFIVATKLNENFVIENLSKSIVKKELFETWAELSKLYFKAYRLPFREDHNVLINRNEFLRTLNLLRDIFKIVQTYIYQTKSFDDENTRTYIHNLKRRISDAMLSAEVYYAQYCSENSTKNSLGMVAVELDAAISSIHKILIDYELPK